MSSQDDWGWKGPQKVSSQTSWSKQDHVWEDSRLLGASSSCGLEITKDGDCKTSLSNQPWLSTWWKRFSLYPAWTSLFSIYASFLPTSHRAPLRKAWLKKLLSKAATAVVYTCSPTADFGLSHWASCRKLASGGKYVACSHVCIKFLFSLPQSNEWNKQLIRSFDDGRS